MQKKERKRAIKMNTLKFIIVVSMVLLASDLVYHQVVNGQNMTISQEEQINSLNQLIYGQNRAILEAQEQIKSLKALIDYCFQHADRPNPIQDLIDKGFLSPTFKGETCISIKEEHDIIGNDLAIKQARKEKAILERQMILSNELNEKTQNNPYLECARNENKTQEECNRIREGIE